MKEKLKIGDISLEFEYHFNEYFGNKLNQYKTKELDKHYHTLKVLVQDEIEEIDGDEKFVFNHKIRVKKNDITYLTTYDHSHRIRHRISFSNDYKDIKIILNKSLGKKLAEYEYVLSGMLFFEIAIHNQYLPIHASAIMVDDKAILLSGPSGSGKSTQTKYFQEVFPDSMIINEDKPLIYEQEGKLFVCGSPWSGKHVINSNIQVEIAHIFFINQSKQTKILSMGFQDKMKQLMRNIHRPSFEEHIDNALYLVDKIIKDVDIVQYDCVNDQTSSQYLKNYLEENNDN